MCRSRRRQEGVKKGVKSQVKDLTVALDTSRRFLTPLDRLLTPKLDRKAELNPSLTYYVKSVKNRVEIVSRKKAVQAVQAGERGRGNCLIGHTRIHAREIVSSLDTLRVGRGLTAGQT